MPSGIPGGMAQSCVLGGIPSGINFLSRVGMVGSHQEWRDPAIPTWDSMWDWQDSARIPPDFLHIFMAINIDTYIRSNSFICLLVR